MEIHRDDKIMMTIDCLWIGWCVVGFFTGGNVTFMVITLVCCLIADYIRYRKYLPWEYQYPIIPNVI